LQKIETFPNLYRLLLPGDKPNKPTGFYYALVKRGGKQFRRSLKTADRKLAERRLAELKNTVGNLVGSDEAGVSFDEAAERWLALTAHELKPRSLERRRTSLKGLSPFFRGLALRNITKAHCERWLTKRGQNVAPQTFAHELSALKRTFNFAVEQGLILGNPAAHIRRRKIHQAKITIPTREQFRQLVTAIRRSDGRADSQRKAGPRHQLRQRHRGHHRRRRRHQEQRTTHHSHDRRFAWPADKAAQGTPTGARRRNQLHQGRQDHSAQSL
jgi:hypothetical protein